MSPHSGRVWIIAISCVCVCMSLVTILFTNWVSGTPFRLTQGIRFVLTILLCLALYQGRSWARWISAILFGLGGLSALGAGVVLVRVTPLAVVLLGMGVVYLSCVALLFLIPSIRHFFAMAHTARS